MFSIATEFIKVERISKEVERICKQLIWLPMTIGNLVYQTNQKVNHFISQESFKKSNHIHTARDKQFKWSGHKILHPFYTYKCQLTVS